MNLSLIIDQIQSLLIFSVIAVPLVLCFLLSWRPMRSTVMALAPGAAVPALLVAAFSSPGFRLELPWLLKQVVLQLDETARVYLIFTGLLYLLAAWYARGSQSQDRHRVRFFALLLATMSGNFGVILAGDIPTFYFSFALMGMASAGLVFHKGSPDAVRAGWLYLGLAMVGEVLLFLGLTTLVTRSGTTSIEAIPASVHTAWTLGLVVSGFGLKAGALTLHFWLPLAHPAAPVPASAVLSGAMIKVGMLGWLRFLPLGEVSYPVLGMVFLGAGLAAAALTTVLAVLQSNPKKVLAYSSIGQMGLMMVGMGAGLTSPQAWASLEPAVLLYVVHHALAKGTLFLAVTPAREAYSRRQVFAARLGVILPALALAGAPFTSGALAKMALKDPLKVWDPFPIENLPLLLSLAAVGTTLKMARFLTLAWPRLGRPEQPVTPGVRVPWAFSVVMMLLIVWILPGSLDWLLMRFEPYLIWQALWPLLAGSALALALRWLFEGRHAAKSSTDTNENRLPGWSAWLRDKTRLLLPPGLSGPGPKAKPPQRESGPEKRSSLWRQWIRGIVELEGRWRAHPMAGLLGGLVSLGVILMILL